MESNWREAFDRDKRDHFEKVRANHENSVCAFVESTTCCLVRVSNIKCDDWGVRMDLTWIPTDGLTKLGRLERDSCEISASWEIFHCGPFRWQAGYVPWSLLLGEPFVDLLKQLVAEGVKKGVPFDCRYAKSHLNRLEYELEKVANADTLTGLEGLAASDSKGESNG